MDIEIGNTRFYHLSKDFDSYRCYINMKPSEKLLVKLPTNHKESRWLDYKGENEALLTIDSLGSRATPDKQTWEITANHVPPAEAPEKNTSCTLEMRVYQNYPERFLYSLDLTITVTDELSSSADEK